MTIYFSNITYGFYFLPSKSMVIIWLAGLKRGIFGFCQYLERQYFKVG